MLTSNIKTINYYYFFLTVIAPKGPTFQAVSLYGEKSVTASWDLLPRAD